MIRQFIRRRNMFVLYLSFSIVCFWRWSSVAVTVFLGHRVFPAICRWFVFGHFTHVNRLVLLSVSDAILSFSLSPFSSIIHNFSASLLAENMSSISCWSRFHCWYPPDSLQKFRWPLSGFFLLFIIHFSSCFCSGYVRSIISQ